MYVIEVGYLAFINYSFYLSIKLINGMQVEHTFNLFGDNNLIFIGGKGWQSLNIIDDCIIILLAGLILSLDLHVHSIREWTKYTWGFVIY